MLCLKGGHSLGDCSATDCSLLAQVALFVFALFLLSFLLSLFFVFAGDLHQTHELLSMRYDLFVLRLFLLCLKAASLHGQTDISESNRGHFVV